VVLSVIVERGQYDPMRLFGSMDPEGMRPVSSRAALRYSSVWPTGARRVLAGAIYDNVRRRPSILARADEVIE